MNARQLFSSSKALTATALLALAGGAAQAGGVHWTVGVDAPIQGPGRVQAVVSNGHRYYAPQPVAYVQAPVVVQQPVYYSAPRYAPQPVVYYQPAPAPRCLPRMASWHERWHRHHGPAAYAQGYGRGYEQGYERGQDDDRRWNDRRWNDRRD